MAITQGKTTLKLFRVSSLAVGRTELTVELREEFAATRPQITHGCLSYSSLLLRNCRVAFVWVSGLCGWIFVSKASKELVQRIPC